MRVDYTNTGCSPINLDALRNNLRLPSDMDSDLLCRLLDSAIDYVESMANHCLVDKTVKVSYIGNMTFYNLKWKVDTITSVKINGTITTDFVLYHNNPSYIKINTMILADDVVEIEYEAKGRDDIYRANEVVIAYASAMYNNPEGLDELDMKRINNRLTSISPI